MNYSMEILDKAVRDKAIAGYRPTVTCNIIGPLESTIEVIDSHGCNATFSGNGAWERAAEFALGSYPKETTVENLHPDSSSYADCFRVLREAKNDGVILNWDYNSSAGIQVWWAYGRVKKFSTDQSKGDIDVLREAANYALELRKQRVPKLEDMTAKQLADELVAAGYRPSATYKAGGNVFTLTLAHDNCNVFPISIDENETLTEFLRRCVEHVRRVPHTVVER